MPKVIEDEVVLRAVVQSIVERGYAGATTKQIADAAGINEVTLFRKYGSKAELVKRAIAGLAELTDFEAATHYSGNVEADLLSVLRAYEGSVVTYARFFSVLFSESWRHPDLVEAFNQSFRLFESVGRLLARYQERGRLEKEHPLQATTALLGPLVYQAMIQSSAPGLEMPPTDLETHVRHFLKGRQAADTT